MAVLQFSGEEVVTMVCLVAGLSPEEYKRDDVKAVIHRCKQVVAEVPMGDVIQLQIVGVR